MKKNSIKWLYWLVTVALPSFNMFCDVFDDVRFTKLTMFFLVFFFLFYGSHYWYNYE